MTTATNTHTRAVEQHGTEPEHDHTPVPEAKNFKSYVPNLVFGVALAIAGIIELFVLNLSKTDSYVYDDRVWVIILVFHLAYMAWPVIRAITLREQVLVRCLVAVGSTVLIATIYPVYMRIMGAFTMQLWQIEAYAFVVGFTAVAFHIASAVGLNWRFDRQQQDAVRVAKQSRGRLEERIADYTSHVGGSSAVATGAQEDYDDAQEVLETAQTEQKVRETELEAAQEALKATDAYRREQEAQEELAEAERESILASDTVTQLNAVLEGKKLSAAQRADHESKREEAEAELQRLVGKKRELNAELAGLRTEIKASPEQDAVTRAKRILKDAQAGVQKALEATKEPEKHLDETSRAHGDMSARLEAAQGELEAAETLITEGKKALAAATRSTLFWSLTPLALAFLLCYHAWYGSTL